MRRPAPPREPEILRLGAVLTGVLLVAGALMAGDLARTHMLILHAICGAGPSAPHCGWCFGAASLGSAGLAAFAWAARPIGALVPDRKRGMRRMDARL